MVACIMFFFVFFGGFSLSYLYISSAGQVHQNRGFGKISQALGLKARHSPKTILGDPKSILTF